MRRKCTLLMITALLLTALFTRPSTLALFEGPLVLHARRQANPAKLPAVGQRAPADRSLAVERVGDWYPDKFRIGQGIPDMGMAFAVGRMRTPEWYMSDGIMSGGITSIVPLPIYFEQSRWGSYKWYIFTGILVFLLEGGLFALLRIETRRRKIADHAATKRREFECLLAKITARLADARQATIVEEIKDCLHQLRSYFTVDTFSIFCRAAANGELHGLSSSPHGIINRAIPPLAIVGSSWLMMQLGQGEAVLINDVDLLPPEAATEKLALENQRIGSIAIVPFATERSILGYLILTVTEPREWPEGLVGQVQILGDVFHQAYLRQKAESKILEMEQRFVLAADTAPVMIWMSGIDRRCTYCNQNWLEFTGRTLDQEVGDGWQASVHPEDVEQCLAEYSRRFDARERFKLEYRLRRFDGDYRWIADYGVPRYEPGGIFCGYIGACTDISELKRSEQELKELSGQLIHAQEDERKRIARELHDDFSQELTLLSLELAKLSVGSNHEPRVEEMVRNVEARIRGLSRAMNSRAHQLHSSHLDILGLPSAIQGFCRDFSKQHEIIVDFRENGVSPHIPSNVALCLFRIVQEALQNVAKHSRTNNCCVELTNDSEGVVLRITDSGIGFDPGSVGQKTGLGLISMRERLRLVNGHIQLLSSPRQGTRLEIHVPLKKQQHELKGLIAT